MPYFLSLHRFAGLIALGLALYYLFSDRLAFDSGLGLVGIRPRLQVVTLFVVAAACLLLASRRDDFFWQKMLGYASLLVGFATVWLIFRGSDIGT